MVIFYKGEDIIIHFNSDTDISTYTKVVKFFTPFSAIKTATVNDIDAYNYTATISDTQSSDLKSGTLNIVVEFSLAGNTIISKSVECKLNDPYANGGARESTSDNQFSLSFNETTLNISFESANYGSILEVTQARDEAVQARDESQVILDTITNLENIGIVNASTGVATIESGTVTLTVTPPTTWLNGQSVTVTNYGVLGFSGINFSNTTMFNVGDKLRKRGSQWEWIASNGDISNVLYTDNGQANSIIKELYISFGATSSILSDIKSIRILKNDTSVGGIYSIALKKADGSDLVLFFYTTTNQTGTELFTVVYQGITAYIVINWSNVSNASNTFTVNLKQNCLVAGLSPRIKQYIDITATNASLATNTTNIATANTNITKINTNISNVLYSDNENANKVVKELYLNFGSTGTVLSDIKTIRIQNNDNGVYSIALKNASSTDLVLFFYITTNPKANELFTVVYQGITAYIVVNWSNVSNAFNSYTVNLKSNCLVSGLSPRIKSYIDVNSLNTSITTNATNISKINNSISNILYTDNDQANAIVKELHLDFGNTGSTLSDVKSIRILKNDSSVGGIYSIALKKADNTDLVLFFYTATDQTGTELFYINYQGIKGYIVVNWSVITNQFNSFTVNLKSNCLVAGLSPRIKQYIDINTTNANVTANTNSISSNTTSITAINGIISNISFSNNLTFNSVFKEFYIDFGVTGIDISVITKVRILKGNLVNGVPIWSISLRKTDNTELILFFYSTTDQTGTEYFTMNTNGIKAYIIVAWNAVLNAFTELTNLVLNKNCLSFNFNPTIQAKIASSNPTTTLEYFSEEVLQQNYFDDLSDGMSQMLRTDKIVLNQGNLGLTSGNKSLYNTLRYTANDDKSLIHYQYISWIDVQEVANTYLFETAITPILQNNANTGKRTILRIFPSSFSGNKNVTYTHLSKLTNTVQTNKIQFPTYVADLMDTNSGQFAEYEGYWLLDVNLDSVYTEYQKLMQAFATWLNTKTLTVNGTTINAKDLILYFEFGLIGPFGEGNWFGIDFTTSVANVTRYYNDVMTLLPNFVIASGMDVWGELGSKKEELFKATKELQNNKGYLGTFIDHIGSYDPKVFASDIITQKQLDYYVARGDFFTGEFATFPKNPYWGGSSGLWTYSLFTRLKMPYVRINNISYQYGFTMYPIGQVSPQTMYKINNCLSVVGFRYVLSNIYSTVASGLLKIEFELSNIGLNKCFFDIYKMYYRVKNLDTLAITDTEITYDLRTLLPKNKKVGQFAIGNGQSFTLENINISSLSAYSVSLIIKDKINLQNPLYLSNYNRQADGSYLLYTNVVS